MMNLAADDEAIADIVASLAGNVEMLFAVCRRYAAKLESEPTDMTSRTIESLMTANSYLMQARHVLLGQEVNPF